MLKDSRFFVAMFALIHDSLMLYGCLMQCMAVISQGTWSSTDVAMGSTDTDHDLESSPCCNGISNDAAHGLENSPWCNHLLLPHVASCISPHAYSKISCMHIQIAKHMCHK